MDPRSLRPCSCRLRAYPSHFIEYLAICVLSRCHQCTRVHGFELGSRLPTLLHLFLLLLTSFTCNFTLHSIQLHSFHHAIVIFPLSSCLLLLPSDCFTLCTTRPIQPATTMSDNTDEPTSTIAFADIDITATQRFINIPWSVDMSMSDAEWYDGQTLINDYYPDPPKCKSDPPPQVQAVLPTPLVLVSAPALENACTTVNESAQHVDTPAVASSAAQTHSQTYISTDQAPPTELPRLNTIKLFTHDVIHPSEEGGIMPGQIETVTDVVQVWECPFRPCDHIYDNELKYHDHMKVSYHDTRSRSTRCAHY